MSCFISYVRNTQLPENEKVRLETVHTKIFTDAKRSGAFREFQGKLYSKKEAYGPAVAFVNKVNKDNGVDVAKLNKIATGQYYISVNVLPLAQKQGDIFFSLNSPSVNYLLKSVEILQSSKADEIFRKGDKNQWSIDKILQELQVPKEQQELIKSFNTRNREEILTSLLANYSYTIEVNTAKTKLNEQVTQYGDTTGNQSFEVDGNKYRSNLLSDIDLYYKNGAQITQEEFFEASKKAKDVNTQYYSNLTVPGGTNYTENEIATPAITPSIKGHAQFSTDNGIGWFRSDEQRTDDNKGKKIPDGAGGLVQLGVTTDSKTRRILEVQSDLFQKGRDTGVAAVEDESKKVYQPKYPTIDKKGSEFLQLLNKDNNWVTFFIKSIIQDSAKKGYEKVLFPSGNTASKVEGHTTLEEFKKQKENRIKELEIEKQNKLEPFQHRDGSWREEAGSGIKYNSKEEAELGVKELNEKNEKRLNNEINQLKQELERVETEGFGALKPIYKFYEETVGNILKKNFKVEKVKDEYGNEWNEVKITPEMANKAISLQIRGTESSKASEKTISIIKDFLKKIGVNIKVGDIVVDGVKIDANGAALIAQKLIQITNGKTDVALTEEAMHFAVEIIKQKDNTLYKKLLSEIGKYKLTEQVFKDYGSNPSYQIGGKPNVIKLKEEAIAKVLAETVIKKNEGSTEKPELLAKVEGWWNTIVEAFKKIFNLSAIDNVAKSIILGDFQGTAKDLDSREVFLQETANPQKQIIDKLKAISATITKLPDDGGYEIGGKKIKHRVSDISKTWYENRLGDKNLTKSEYAEAVDDLKKEKGTGGHADIQYILQNVLLDGEGKFIKDPSKRLDDSGYVSQIDPNNRGIYSALKTSLEDRLASFPEDTVFLAEVTIYNPTRDLAGTIDFLAIEPSGKTHILDWKFMDLNVDQYEDVPWYKVGAWNTQMSNYKQILKNAYNIPFNGSEQTRMIPIRAKYTPGNAKMNILPKLESIEIGGINLKDEKRSYLLPVGLPEERTGNKKIDNLVEQLNKVYEVLSTKSVTPEKKIQKAEQLNALYKAVRQLQMRQNIQPLIEQAKVLNKEVGRLIEEFNVITKEEGSVPKEDRQEFSGRILGLENSLKIYTSLYTNLKGLFAGDLTEDQSKLKENLKKASEDANDLEQELSEVRQQLAEQIANDENVLDFLAPEKIVKGLSRWFGSTSNLQVKSVQILYKMANRALSKATIDTTEQGNILKNIKVSYDKWAKEKGLSSKNYFNILKKEDSNELIDEFDTKFFKELKSKIHDKDRKWVIENVEVSKVGKAINEVKEEEYKRIENKVRHHDNPIDSAREVELEKRKADELYNISTSESPGWLLYNIVKQFPKDKWQTKEWVELHKKGNEPALAFYDYIRERNDKYQELGYINHSARTFLPWVRKSFMEKLAMGGDIRLAEGALRTITVSEGDVGYGQIDPITKQPVYTIPKYFTRDVGEEVSSDLFKNMTLLNEMAIRYEYLSEIENQMNLIIRTESNKSAIKTSYFGKTKYKADGEVEVTSDNTENTKLVQDMMEAIVYGHKYIESENFDQLLGNIGNFGKKANKALGKNIFPEKFDNTQVSLNKTVTMLNNFFQLKTLGFNPISALSNFLGGSFQSYINAGTYFTKSEFLKNEFLITGRMNGVDAKKYLAALEYFVPLTENYNSILAKNLSISNYTPENIQDILMWMMRKGDQYVQSVNFFSYLDNSIILDGKIVNAREHVRNSEEYQNIYNVSPNERKSLEKSFEEKVRTLVEEKGLMKTAQLKDGKLIIPGIDSKSDSVIELRRKVQSLTKDALGNLSEDDIRKINLNIMGKSFMIFKNWIPRLVDVRFGNLKYNSASEAYEWGRTRMMTRLLFSNFRETISNLSSAIAGNDEKWVGQMKELWEAKREEYRKDTGKELKMTERQFLDLVRKNVNNQLTDFMFFCALTGLFIGAKALGPDDKKDRATINKYRFLLRVIDKVRDEISYFYNPTSLSTLTTSGIFPSLSYLDNLKKLLGNFGKEMYYIGTDNEKEQEKNYVIKYFLKGFPITSQFDSVLLMFFPDVAKDLGLKSSSESRPLGK